MGRLKKPVVDNSGADIASEGTWALYKRKPRRYANKEIVVWRGYNNYLYLSSKFCRTIQEILGMKKNIFFQLRYNADLNAIWLRFEPLSKGTPVRNGYVVSTSSMRFSITKFLAEFKLTDVMKLSQQYAPKPYLEMDKIKKNKGGELLPPSTNWIVYLDETSEDFE